MPILTCPTSTTATVTEQLRPARSDCPSDTRFRRRPTAGNTRAP
jgi:hypothetical protein